MESNITEPQHFPNDSLNEPHFDEEATVAAARPVVPIQEIKAKKLSRSRLAFGLTILASVVIGALGATLVYKQRNRLPASAIVESAVTGVGAISQGAAVETSAAEIQTENFPKDADVLADDADVSAVVEKETSPAAPKSNAVKIKRQTVSVPQMDETETQQRERVEARRLRRRAEREAEREARRNERRGDDLLRIREIFEGRRRP